MASSKEIKVFSFAYIHALSLGFIGLICGIIYSFGGFIIDGLVTLDWIASSETPGLSYGTVLAFGALVGMPLIFAFVGFVLGAIVALIYNLISRWFEKVDIYH